MAVIQKDGTPPLEAVPPHDGSTASTKAAVSRMATRQRPAIGRRIVVVVIVLLAIILVQSFVTNSAVGWATIGKYLFNARVLQGVLLTIEITFCSLLVGFASGLLIAIMRLSASLVLRVIAIVWVWFFRAVPVLVILIVVNNIALLYPRIGIGIPFGPLILSVGTASLITPFLAAVLAFGANEGAYASEIFRAAIGSVAKGQWEAATALGMSRGRIYRRIILPQAMRFAVPPLANNSINMLKGTSLVAFIGVSDLVYTVQSIYAQNYLVMPLLFVACIWYLVLVSAMTGLQVLLERKFSQRGKSPRKGLVTMELSNDA